MTHSEEEGNVFILECGLIVGSGLWTKAASGLISIPSMDRATKNPETLIWGLLLLHPRESLPFKEIYLPCSQACSRIAVAVEVWDENAYSHGARHFCGPRAIPFTSLLLSVFNIHHGLTGVKEQQRMSLQRTDKASRNCHIKSNVRVT